MAIIRILVKDEEILRKICKPVVEFNEQLGKILDDMAETLHGVNGVGLAAPQVGYQKRFAIIDVDGEGEVVELINPVILKTAGKQRGVEGCLSCPEEFGYVTRPDFCKVRAQDRNGNFFEVEFFELGARCACHEIDHLDGKLFLDIVEEMVEIEEDEED